MRVVILQDYLRCGGTENQSVFLQKFLNQNSIDTYLITIMSGGSLEKRITYPEKHFCLNSPLNWFAPTLIKHVRSIKPDIILLMGRIANMYGWLLQEKFEGSCSIITTMRSGRALPYFYKKSLRVSDLTLVNSCFAKELLEKQDIQTSLIQVIHNAFLYEDREDKTSKSENGKFTILNLAAFVPGKNHSDWIHVGKILSYKMKQPFEIWFLGEGPERQSFEQNIKENKLDHCLKVFGFQDNPTEFYKQADIAVSVSLEESLPNFLVEAQFHGLPVVSYDTAGCRECFEDEKSGFLVKQGAVNDLCKYIIELEQNKALHNKMSEAAREFAKSQFSQQTIGAKFLKAFQTLRNRKRVFKASVI